MDWEKIVMEALLNALIGAGATIIVAVIGYFAVVKKDHNQLFGEHKDIMSKHNAISKEQRNHHREISNQLKRLNASAHALEMESSAERERWKRLFDDNKFSPQNMIDQIIAMSDKINALQAINSELSQKLEASIKRNNSLRKQLGDTYYEQEY